MTKYQQSEFAFDLFILLPSRSPLPRSHFAAHFWKVAKFVLESSHDTLCNFLNLSSTAGLFHFLPIVGPFLLADLSQAAGTCKIKVKMKRSLC